MNKIRILLADDHPVVRAGVRAFLEDEPDMVVVGEAATAHQAIALAQELRPDVAVLDISMPGSGLDATHQIHLTCPGTQILILTFHRRDDFLLTVLKAGATGYVLKSAADTELLNAIRVVAQGGAFLSPIDARQVVADYQAHLAKEQDDSDVSLSEREREVLKLIALGHTAGEAAKILTLSPKSVETYRTRIMQKLGLHNRAAVVQYALLHHLLNEDFQYLSDNS